MYVERRVLILSDVESFRERVAKLIFIGKREGLLRQTKIDEILDGSDWSEERIKRVAQLFKDRVNVRVIQDRAKDVVDEITDRKSTRLNSSHVSISYAVFCLNKNKKSSYSRTR